MLTQNTHGESHDTVPQSETQHMAFLTENDPNDPSDVLPNVLPSTAKSTQGTRPMREPELEQDVQNLMNELRNQERELQKEYATFILEDAIENEAFCELLMKGYSLKHAFELSHAQSIFEQKLDRAKQAWLNEMQHNASRPSEEASSPTFSSDEIDFSTKQERADLIKRVARGEIITL